MVFKNNKIFLFFLFSFQLFIISTISHEIGCIFFADDAKVFEGDDYKNKPFYSLNIWQKVQYCLSEKDSHISCCNIKNLSQKQNGIYDISTQKTYDKLVFFNINGPDKLQKLKSFQPKYLTLIMWEPPSVYPHQYCASLHKHFGTFLTWQDDLVDNKRYFKFYYPDIKEMIQIIPEFSEKKLSCMVVANKSSNYVNELYSQRKKAIDFFERYNSEDFGLYGVGWENLGLKNYKGSFSGDKRDVMKNYKFSICFENTKDIQGYITEKILDSFASACVPVYWGASNVTDFIPANCFIDMRDFSSYEELYQYLKNMTEEQYSTYIDNIKKYLQSEKAKFFSSDYFAQNLAEVLAIGKY